MGPGDLRIGRSRGCIAGCVGLHPSGAAEKSLQRPYGLAVRPADHAGVLRAAPTDRVAIGRRITDPTLAADTGADARPASGDQRWVAGRFGSAGPGHAAPLR